MRLLLIVPEVQPCEHYEGIFDGQYFRFIPGLPCLSMAHLAFPTIAGLTPEGVEIIMIDEGIENINFDAEVDLIGVTVKTPLANRAYMIADEFRKRGRKVILGGLHASMMPQEAIKHSDSVLIGRAENVWNEVINDFKCNKLKKFYQSHCEIDWPKIPLPRHDLIPHKENYFSHSIETSIGCPNKCTFCVTAAFWQGKYYCKPIRRVLKEVEEVMCIEKKPIFFCDDNFIGDIARTKKLCKELIPLKVEYGTLASLRIGKDEELLGLLARSGCKSLHVGFESVSEQTLKQVNKDAINKPEEYLKIIEKVWSYGIGITGFFVYGFDDDDPNVFQRTVDFINSTNLRSTINYNLVPYPFIPLFKKLADESRILTTDWSKYMDYGEVVFQPKRMSPEDLRKGVDWVNNQELLRIFKKITNWGSYYWELFNKKFKSR